MPKAVYAGVINAMVTPFREDGAVNLEVMERHINWLLDQGIRGVMLTGTAGEFPNLADQERVEIARHAVKVVSGRVPVIFHTGHMNRESMLALSREAEKAGADALMLVPPPICKPNQEELVAYFQEVAASVSIDVVIYNNPTRVGVKINADTLVRLAEVPNIAALKDSGRSMEDTTQIVNQAGDKMAILSGEGDLFLPILALGGVGGILTVCNVAPRMHVGLFEAFQRGDLQRARLLNQQLIDFAKLLGSEGKYHAAVKAAMREAGIPVGMPRRPLTDISPEAKARIRQRLELLGLMTGGV